MKEFARRSLTLILAGLHWFTFALIAIFFAFIASFAFKFAAAGLDIAAFLAAIAGAAVVVILLFPLVFFRLPTKAKVASYVLVLPALFALTGTSSALDEAHKRTSQGMREAKAEAQAAALQEDRDRKAAEQARRDAEQARQAKARQDEENAVRDNLQYIAAAQEKVQGCINWRGQVPSLVRHVRESLHNPRSFEHVHSEMRLQGDNPLTGFPVIVMEYRAENGFGAIRTATVTAKIVPDDCTVHSVEFSAD